MLCGLLSSFISFLFSPLLRGEGENRNRIVLLRVTYILRVTQRAIAIVSPDPYQGAVSLGYASFCMPLRGNSCCMLRVNCTASAGKWSAERLHGFEHTIGLAIGLRPAR